MDPSSPRRRLRGRMAATSLHLRESPLGDDDFSVPGQAEPDVSLEHIVKKKNGSLPFVALAASGGRGVDEAS